MSLNQAFKCNTIEETADLLHEYGERAKIIAGGTDIVVHMKEDKLSPEVLIDIAKIQDLKIIKEEEGKIIIGASSTFTEVMESGLFDGNMYGLYKALRMVGSPQIRNKGTIGGNVANGSPAADSVPPLIALGATLKIISKNNSREVSIEDFFENRQKYGLKPDELLTYIEFKKPDINQYLSFSKLGLRKALAISRITISMLVESENNEIKNIKIASGSIGKYPMREKEVEVALKLKSLDDDIISMSVKALQDSMDERLKGRGTLPYKRRATVSLLEECIEQTKGYFKEVNK